MQALARRVSQLTLVIPLLILLFPFLTSVEVQAQQVRARFRLETGPTAILRVQLDHASAREWSFLNSYGNVLDISNRIENLTGQDKSGRSVPIIRVAPGVWRADEDVTQLGYQVNLSPPNRLGELSRLSWCSAGYGLLMPRDLLPQDMKSIDLTLNLPDGWTSAAVLKSTSPSRYQVDRVDKTVIAIGKALREKSIGGARQFKLITTGNWAFKDTDASKVAKELLGEHARIFRRGLFDEGTLILLPLPASATSDQWTAETQGSTVVLLMGVQAKRKPALVLLKVVLAHEMFHLWVPNALELRGGYDWFFEGFTVYQALLTGLRLRYINFEEYLTTLGRVYDSYRSSAERDKLSLLEASERRWTTTSPLVYDKGALVAFIYDLMLRTNSLGLTTLNDIYPELLSASSKTSEGANDLILKILDARPGLQQFSDRFIRGSMDIDLPILLKGFGLEVVTVGSNSGIKVSKDITTAQRRILKSLGYKS